MSSPDSRPFGAEWIAAYFREVDRMDVDGLLVWYADGARFRFAGQPPVVGKSAIRETLSEFYRSIDAMHHRQTGIWVDPAECSGVFEAEVDFSTKDGRAVTLPAVSVLRLKENRVSDFRFVMDPSPLFGPLP